MRQGAGRGGVRGRGEEGACGPSAPAGGVFTLCDGIQMPGGEERKTRLKVPLSAVAGGLWANTQPWWSLLAWRSFDLEGRLKLDDEKHLMGKWLRYLQLESRVGRRGGNAEGRETSTRAADDSRKEPDF